MQKRKAFTFIELSIVLILILVIITGITKAGSMMQTSRVVGARAFTATSIVPKIKGLVAWYEASSKESFAGVADGDQILSWNDIGPSLNNSKSNNLTNAGSDEVTYVDEGINSIPSVLFKGSTTSSRLVITSFYQGTLAQSTRFVVFSPLETIGSITTLLDSDSSGSISSVSVRSTHVDISAATGTLVSDAVSNGINAGEAYILAVKFNGALSEIYFNDANASSSVDPGSNSIKGLTIGSALAGDQRFNGLISEVIIYNRPLNLQERRDVFRYLSDKYKITVTGI